VLSDVNELYNNWRTVLPAPFALSSDPVWLDTGRAVAGVGLPWHNNEVNLPTDIDTSWPFHFKEFEAELLRTKGARVGDPNPSGYVTSYYEANLYCIRALQQELREQCPTRRPLLVYNHFDTQLATSAAKLFGLEVRRISLSNTVETVRQELLGATFNGYRPIIFAATLCNSASQYDDLGVLCRLSEEFPLILHVDAFRSFDYITVSPHFYKRRPEFEVLKLAARDLRKPLRAVDNSVIASTIVAGGLNHSRQDPAVALKPETLGEKPKRVSYIRAFDSTLSGSRDAIAPLWSALYEKRLGGNGLRELCQYLESLQSFVSSALESCGISTDTSSYSTDVVVRSCTESQRAWLLGLGGAATTQGDIILSMNPHLSAIGLHSILFAEMFSHCHDRTGDAVPRYKDFVTLYPVPQGVLNDLQGTVQSWQVLTRTTTGYPLHMGSYSALGPLVGLFWDLNVPKDWVEKRSREILSSRMEAFGLVSPESKKDFKGIFTNGSTMGNRCGIMTALEHFPNAFAYFSAETHYSVIKTLRDCDTLTNRWTGGKPRYAQICCDSNGSISVDALVQRAIADRKRCIEAGVEYSMILLANLGTTFVGARDDLVGIYRGLQEVGIQASYIHVDGALDFGFGASDIRLGPCGAVGDNGMPLVQGITISHHKALGQMVCGEVLCFSPGNQLPSVCPSRGSTTLAPDPRAVFETWLYSQVYAPADLGLMLRYCRDNASRLDKGLKDIGIATKRNEDSIITVLERPPAWIIEEYSLRPEGDWVHFITMPHVSPETVDCFVDQVADVEKQFVFAFSCVKPLLSDALGRDVRLKRVGCRGPVAERVVDVSRVCLPLDHHASTDTDVSCAEYSSTLGTSVKAGLRGALSIVAVDEQDGIQLVLLIGSNRDQSVHVGPLFVKNEFAFTTRGLIDIVKLLVGLLARRLRATICVDGSSYTVYTFAS